MDVNKMDEDYFNSLLSQREANPDNLTTQRRIDNCMQDNFKNTVGDDVNCYREFVPGQPWMSREQRERQDLNIIMDEIEVSISVLKHKTAALHIVYDILDQAVTCGSGGRDLARDIQDAIKDHDREDSKRNRRMKEKVQTQSVQTDRINLINKVD